MAKARAQVIHNINKNNIINSDKTGEHVCNNIDNNIIIDSDMGAGSDDDGNSGVDNNNKNINNNNNKNNINIVEDDVNSNNNKDYKTALFELISNNGGDTSPGSCVFDNGDKDDRDINNNSNNNNDNGTCTAGGVNVDWSHPALDFNQVGVLPVPQVGDMVEYGFGFA
ncbi:hypothetical protein CBR_g37127 [Chara braunii]|uniref:Uncharacterized protein n=1 Tax=Chara braunii TaxID=69332 RepID=A0A388LMG8_CHABU|nr:hypothetical protein CBR_g37127 [Chara braunii]|eukprot:GBG83413.1 hypothetical protein CBR_g37127 [Chara braunii]